MKKDELKQLALKFREAIQITVREREYFCKNDRLQYFPCGGCDDSAEMFAYYLLEKFGIHAVQVNGVLTDENGYRQNHQWVRMPSKLIVDLTVDQFEYFLKKSVKVYVGDEGDFYTEFTEKVEVDNSMISLKNERLLHDYRMICRHLEG